MAYNGPLRRKDSKGRIKRWRQIRGREEEAKRSKKRQKGKKRREVKEAKGKEGEERREQRFEGRNELRLKERRRDAK